MLELARERLPASVKFAKADLARLPFANHHFDVVLLSSVLEYLPQPEVALAELRRVAKPGAILLAGVPNVRSIYRSLETIASSAIGLPRYRRHVNPDVPSAANALITAAGFQITDELLYASPPGLRVLTLSSWAGVHPRFATMRLIAATAA
jgi:SAM-dependent methyltransferase